MSITQRFKSVVNPLNTVITGVIILFISIRVFSTNHENTFVIAEITATDSQLEVPYNQQTEQSQALQTESQTEETIKSIIPSNSQVSPAEPLAYSAELEKTYTLEAFNKLTKEELMTFSGIGEVTAQAILDYRRDNGPFGQFDELMSVKGIGEKKLLKIMTILP